MKNLDSSMVALLRAIQEFALVPYPFKDDETGDPKLILTLGQIAGLAMKAISEHERKTEEDDGA